MVLILAPVMLLLPVLGFPVVLLAASDTQKYKYSMILLLGAFFGVMGYYFVPKIDTDLVRYFSNYVDVMRGSSWNSIMSSGTSFDNIFIVQKFIFFIASRFNDNQVLPLITMFITYTNGLYVVTNYSQKNKISIRLTFIMLLLFLVGMTFAILANNTRNIVAVSFFVVAIYRDLYLRNTRLLTLLFYGMAVSMHIATVPLIMVRVTVSLIDTIREKNLFRFVLTAVVLIFSLIVLVKTGLWSQVTEKGASYLMGGGSGTDLAQWFATADSSKAESTVKYVSMFFCVIFDLILGVSFYLSHNNNSSQLEFYLAVFVYNIVVIAMIFQPGTTWLRFYFVTMYFIPIIFYAGYKIKNKNIKGMLLVFWICFFIWSIMIQLYRLNQQTDITSFMTNVFFHPIIGIFMNGG